MRTRLTGILEFEAMQASINTLTEALAAKLAPIEEDPVEPIALLTTESSGILIDAQPIEPTQNADEAVLTPKDTADNSTETNTEPAVDSAPTPEASDVIVVPTSDAPSAATVDGVDAAAPTEPFVKKHVKRSSFFGGFFG